jgi:Raf kinase inhibitor-like YbhB/YbcL family protein
VRLLSASFADGEMIPDRHAFARPDPETRVRLSENVNPHLAWDGVPDNTRSFAIICVDGVCPSKPDDVNHPDREVPPDLPRVDFVHWVIVDLPDTQREIAEGQVASGVVPGGQDAAAGPAGRRQGVNDYTSWFEGDPTMEGTYLGCDGPAPPWNDSLVHEYEFTVYALDVPRLPVVGGFTASEVTTAMQGHILDQASITGRYTLNPRLR